MNTDLLSETLGLDLIGGGASGIGAGASSFSSPSTPPSQPSDLGPLSSPASRKLFINLISTLNAAFPDYDFADLKPNVFRRETAHVEAVVNVRLSSSQT